MRNSNKLSKTSIIRATKSDAKLLADLGRQTFIESHGHSAPKEDIDNYVNQNYTREVLLKELSDAENIYHIIYYEGKPVGFSKIKLNYPTENIQMQNVTKLEKIFLLKEFYQLKLGLDLFNFNVELSKNNNQAGMWLFVWTENERAYNFYLKNGFAIIGSHDFKISANHSNPAHQMLLKY